MRRLACVSAVGASALSAVGYFDALGVFGPASTYRLSWWFVLAGVLATAAATAVRNSTVQRAVESA